MFVVRQTEQSTTPRVARLVGPTWLLSLAVVFAAATIGQSSEDTASSNKPAKSDATTATNSSDEDTFWSLRPLTRPSVPRAAKAFEHFSPANPIDQFVLSKLVETRLEPSPPADRRTLIRRVYFDLLGLPPTPEEVDLFVADPEADAYEKLVDRLLASPQFGERWARHWMDVAHYAETHGHDQDRPRPNAWPYRDYLIRSFNEDKPYEQFVQEQIAGDVLFPDDPWATIATGFLATGPWDESSLMSIQDDTDDRRIAQYLDRDDMVMTAMSSFASTTVHCARCHDHFFDPITQADYYALQAVFAGVDKADRTFDFDAQVGQRRKAFQREIARLRTLKDKIDPSLLSPEMQQFVSVWEKDFAARPPVWEILQPIEVKSSDGSMLTKQPDGSVVSGDKRPERDTYTLEFHTALRGLTALRLEVLTHDSLSKRGPGRQDNGNLHLSEIKVFAERLPDANTATTTPAPESRRELKNPRADFNQDGWTIAHAIDGNPGTAWGIYPKVGEDHRAVLEFAEPVNFDGRVKLTVVLEQLHGGGHLIGRPRVSVTTARESLSLDADVLPADITAILQTPATQRSEQQRCELARFARVAHLERELVALPPQQMVYAATSELKTDGLAPPTQRPPRPVHVLARGNIKQPGDLASPGALSCVRGVPARFEISDMIHEGARRAALAKWFTHPRNVLVWRSAANRIWHHHFGRGLCDTPNDLGQMGGRPSHPALLDWLACELRGELAQEQPLAAEDVGRFPRTLKRFHRLIVTSATYRQSSQHDDRWAAKDSDNRLLWRMHRTRLDAESVRDAISQVTGRLDRTMGGPSAKQFIQTPGIHVTPNVDYANFDPDRPENNRRSVYRFVFRTLPDPFMDSLDCADSSQLTPVRNSSVTALQALSMLNNNMIVRQGEHLAARIAATSTTRESQAALAFRWILLREPTAREQIVLTEFVQAHGLSNACRLLLNSNEFLFVD